MKACASVLAPAMLMVCGVAASPVFAQTPAPTPQATSPYTLSVFASAPAGLSAPDDIAVLDDHVFVGYGDGHDPGGVDGLSSQVVEYNMDGSVVHTYTVLGHVDGVKVDPITHKVWTLENEDGNTRLVIIDPKTRHTSLYIVGTGPHGGGYDDILFRGCKVYFSASNPLINPNTAPAIVSVKLKNGTVDLDGVLEGDANAINIPKDTAVTLNLQDPDSMTQDLLGNLVLDSQGDQQLIIVSNPGSFNQRVLQLPLSYQTSSGPTGVEVDDTVFITSSEGFILFADKGLNKVFKLSKNAFAPGSAYTAADGGPFVGTLDLSSGLITPVVTGLKGPGGMAFVDMSEHGWSPWKRDEDSCRDDRE
jgi:hypothetical protein